MHSRFRGVALVLAFLLTIFSQYGCKRPFIVNTLNASKFDKLINKESPPQIIDVRTPAEFNIEHLKGALNMDPTKLDSTKKLLEIFNLGKPTFVYCSNGEVSPKAATKLESMGFNNVYILEGGFKSWKKSGKPVEVGPPPVLETGMTLSDLNKKIDTVGYVLVCYGSVRWNEPSMKLVPILEKIAKDRKGQVKFVKVDVNDDYRITKEKNLPGVPFIELYLNGKLKWSHKGFMDEADILKETEL